VRIPVWGRGIPGKAKGWEKVQKRVIKDLGRNPGYRRGISEKNSCLRTGTLTDSKGFGENSGLGKGISGKTSGFIRETFSRLERV
jgi:hypothetical protein